MNGTMHVLYSTKAEGCPRLALTMLEVEREYTGRTGSVVTLTDECRDLDNDFRDIAGSIECLHRRRKDFVGVGFRARRIMQKLRPSGVICYPLGFHVPICAAATSLGIPAVAHIGNAPPTQDVTGRRKLKAVMLAGLPFVKRYVACSDFVRAECCRTYGLPYTAVSTVANGIPLRRFLSCRRVRPNGVNKDLIVGMVGSLECHKDQSTLLKAVALLRRDSHAVKLSLVGSGSKESTLRHLASELGISRAVTWRGSVTDVTSELNSFDVFAYSVQGEEGLGIALIEALAAGVPTVASNVGACREVLDNGRWGILVAPGDEHRLADAILIAAHAASPPAECVRRFDIVETFRAYQRLLSPTMASSSISA